MNDVNWVGPIEEDPKERPKEESRQEEQEKK